MDAYQFFKQATGEEPTAAEATGNIPLDVLLKLIDARIDHQLGTKDGAAPPFTSRSVTKPDPDAERDSFAAKRQAELDAEREGKINRDSEVRRDFAKPDPENGAAPLSEAPEGSEA